MTDRLFLDTNILVYAYDNHEPEKQRIAQQLLKESIAHESAVLSVQVLGEFFTVVTKKINSPMSADDARRIIATLRILPVETVDYPLVQRAIETHIRYRIQYWDALVVAAAERANCTTIATEDFAVDQKYNGIAVFNPFSSRRRSRLD
jgi:predicted nucleic acid-binding protein